MPPGQPGRQCSRPDAVRGSAERALTIRSDNSVNRNSPAVQRRVSSKCEDRLPTREHREAFWPTATQTNDIVHMLSHLPPFDSPTNAPPCERTSLSTDDHTTDEILACDLSGDSDGCVTVPDASAASPLQQAYASSEHHQDMRSGWQQIPSAHLYGASTAIESQATTDCSPCTVVSTFSPSDSRWIDDAPTVAALEPGTYQHNLSVHSLPSDGRDQSREKLYRVEIDTSAATDVPSEHDSIRSQRSSLLPAYGTFENEHEDTRSCWCRWLRMIQNSWLATAFTEWPSHSYEAGWD